MRIIYASLDPDPQHWLKHSFLTDIRRVPARPGDPGRRRGSEPAGRPSSQRLGSPRTRALHSRWEHRNWLSFSPLVVWIGYMPYLGVDISHSFLSFSMSVDLFWVWSMATNR